MSQSSLFALDLLNDINYKRISSGGVQAAVATIATYLTTMRSQGTAWSCVAMLRDLIEDILRGQAGNTNETVAGTAATAENLIVDHTNGVRDDPHVSERVGTDQRTSNRRTAEQTSLRPAVPFDRRGDLSPTQATVESLANSSVVSRVEACAVGTHRHECEGR
ncbi:MAG: hypothetical protein NVS9B2_27100 [Steroidobacteraceae bacterium]